MDSSRLVWWLLAALLLVALCADAHPYVYRPYKLPEASFSRVSWHCIEPGNFWNFSNFLRTLTQKLATKNRRVFLCQIGELRMCTVMCEFGGLLVLAHVADDPVARRSSAQCLPPLFPPHLRGPPAIERIRRRSRSRPNSPESTYSHAKKARRCGRQSRLGWCRSRCMLGECGRKAGGGD